MYQFFRRRLLWPGLLTLLPQLDTTFILTLFLTNTSGNQHFPFLSLFVVWDGEMYWPPSHIAMIGTDSVPPSRYPGDAVLRCEIYSQRSACLPPFPPPFSWRPNHRCTPISDFYTGNRAVTVPIVVSNCWTLPLRSVNSFLFSYCSNPLEER